MGEKDKKSRYAVLCMFIGAGLGIAAGFAAGVFLENTGISMCYGLVIGMAIGAAIGAVIKKNG